MEENCCTLSTDQFTLYNRGTWVHTFCRLARFILCGVWGGGMDVHIVKTSLLYIMGNIVVHFLQTSSVYIVDEHGCTHSTD